MLNIWLVTFVICNLLSLLTCQSNLVMSDQVALWSDKAQTAIKRLFSYIPDMSYTDYIIIDRWHAIYG